MSKVFDPFFEPKQPVSRPTLTHSRITGRGRENEWVKQNDEADYYNPGGGMNGCMEKGEEGRKRRGD